MTTGYKRIYFDTTPLIYYLDSVHGCDVFLTNDKQLKQVEEIHVLLVDEL